MSKFIKEFTRAAKETPKMYFAPLIGAFQAVKREVQAGSSEGKPDLVKTKRRMHQSFQKRRHKTDAA